MENKKIEIWKDIPGYEGRYQVSDEGRVRSVDRVITCSNKIRRKLPGKILSPAKTPDGHLLVNLGLSKEHRARKVHQLVALSFLGPCSTGLEVCHNDGDPANNAVSNLRYGTRSENLIDYVRENGCTKKKVLSVRTVQEIRNLLERGFTQTETARQLGVSRYCVNDVARGRTWKWVE